jgi:hypothetical protein
VQAHFQYRLTKDEYVVGLAPLMDQLGRQDTGRISRLLEQLAMILVILAVIAVAFPQAFVGLLVATMLLAILHELLRPRWMQSASGTSYDPAVADHDVEITDGAIRSQSTLRDRQWSWAAVRRIHDLKQAIVLELVGWDMIVLPNRLWENGDARRAFLGEIHSLATDAFPTKGARRPITIDARDLLTVGALGAAVDALFLIVHAFPAHRGSAPAISDAAFVGTFAAVMLLGLAISYGIYRIAKIGLNRLHDAAPAFATATAYVLIWAVPLYILLDYLGWT